MMNYWVGEKTRDRVWPMELLAAPREAGVEPSSLSTQQGENGVLVLNQNFEPLNICDLRRGIGLLLLEKADVITYSNRSIVSTDEQFSLPSVLRLRRQVKRPMPRLRITRRSVLARDDYTCQYCGDKSNLTIDHVFPRHRGGETTWENVVACCQPCNNRKGNRTPQECNMRLPRPPHKPRFVPFISFPRFISALHNPDWKPFLEGYGKGLER